MRGGHFAFSPEDFASMRTALDNACRALAFAFPDGVDVPTQSLLTRSIHQHARLGLRNPMLLSSHALRELPPMAARVGH
jgi:hypothetical protein